MTPTAIVSYDDTLNDHDALMLGRLLAEAGMTLTLVYVRHTTQLERDREELEEHEAAKLLERGARWLGDLDVARRVVVSGSTSEGLRRLAGQEEADVIVFGSDYRTAPGHVSPQHSTQALLDGGQAGLAIAPANYRAAPPQRPRRIGVLAEPGDDAALRTAHGLAERFRAIVTNEQRTAELLVVGSRSEAREGQVMITARAQNAIEDSTVPVLVTPRGAPISFATLLVA